MPIGEICVREVVVVQREETVQEAARLMREHHVGDVILVEEREGGRWPVGVVTDRDLVVEVVATGLDPGVITVGDIAVPELVSVKEDCGVFEAIGYMRVKGVRRLPVVDEQGWLAGLVTLDDLLGLLAEELGALARLVAREQERESETRPR